MRRRIAALNLPRCRDSSPESRSPWRGLAWSEGERVWLTAMDADFRSEGRLRYATFGPRPHVLATRRDGTTVATLLVQGGDIVRWIVQDP